MRISLVWGSIVLLTFGLLAQSLRVTAEGRFSISALAQENKKSLEVPFPCRQALGGINDGGVLAQVADVFPLCPKFLEFFDDGLVDTVVGTRLKNLYEGYDSLEKDPLKRSESSRFWTQEDSSAPVCNPLCGDGLEIQSTVFDSTEAFKTEPEDTDTQFEPHKSYQEWQMRSYPYPEDLSAPKSKSCQVLTEDGYWMKNLGWDDPDFCSDARFNWATIDPRKGHRTRVSQSKPADEWCEKQISILLNSPQNGASNYGTLAPYYAGIVAQATWAALSQTVASAPTNSGNPSLAFSVQYPTCQALGEQYLLDLKAAATRIQAAIQDPALKQELAGRMASWDLKKVSDSSPDQTGNLQQFVQALVMQLGGESLALVAACEVHFRAQAAQKKFVQNTLAIENGTLADVMRLFRDRAAVFCSYFPAEECSEGEVDEVKCRKEVREEGTNMPNPGLDLVRSIDFPNCFHWHFVRDWINAVEDTPEMENQFRTNPYTGLSKMTLTSGEIKGLIGPYPANNLRQPEVALPPTTAPSAGGCFLVGKGYF